MFLFTSIAMRTTTIINRKLENNWLYIFLGAS